VAHPGLRGLNATGHTPLVGLSITLVYCCCCKALFWVVFLPARRPPVIPLSSVIDHAAIPLRGCSRHSALLWLVDLSSAATIISARLLSSPANHCY